MKNSGTLFVACLVSAAAGVAVGMLLAPEKGEDLRKSLKDKFAGLIKEANGVLSEAKRANPTMEE